MEEKRKHSRLLYWAVFITLPLLAIALIVFVVMNGMERITSAAVPKLERAVTRSILESIASIRATNGDVLVLAEVEVMETFRDDDKLSYKVPYSDYNVPIGTTMSEIRAPAMFRYYVKLSDPMEVKVSRHGDLLHCVVVAPKLQPMLPVAFDSEKMEVRIETSWLRFNKEEAKDKIIRSLTTKLNERAPEHAELAKDKAKEAFGKFVREWLLRDHLIGGNGVSDVIIHFADEPQAEIDRVSVE
ncbi:MAG: hypothetical protein LBV12_10640 [Puniceicoccales bacterium]|jgi:hypothetical protein|nr:hypothetical protein [Puniceicoccales bacterium]